MSAKGQKQTSGSARGKSAKCQKQTSELSEPEYLASRDDRTDAQQALRSLSWQEEERESEDQVDGKELQPLEPVGPSIACNLSRVNEKGADPLGSRRPRSRTEQRPFGDKEGGDRPGSFEALGSR